MNISNQESLKERENYGLLFLLIVIVIILSIKITTHQLVLFLILLSILWILRYPSKATYLLAFTIPLSPYLALFELAHTSREYLMVNFTDLIVFGLLLSLFLNFCLQKKSSEKYPLLKINIAVLILYLCLLVITGLIRPVNEFIFQLFYLLRYALYFMIGFYVWKYLPIKNLENYILMLLSGLLINSIYAIYEFVDSVFQGRFLRYGSTPRVSGLWGIMVGGYSVQDIADPGSFGMYLLISLLVNISYLFYKTPMPGGVKKKLAMLSLLFGFIALHMTMSRAAIYAFWGVCLYLLIFEGGLHFKRKIILSFSLIILVGIFTINYVGIDLVDFLITRLYFETSHETIQEGRFGLTADMAGYIVNNFLQWWGHGISSSRLYVNELFEKGVIRSVSGSLYNGYLGILWDGGLIGIFIWALWVKRHLDILSNIKKRINTILWFTVSLKGILIGFLIAMLSAEFLHNFRLMGYFSFLMGMLLKYTYQKSVRNELEKEI